MLHEWLFNIEFISLNVEDQKNGIRVNDPSNPGRTYLSGKGLTSPLKLEEPYLGQLNNEIQIISDLYAKIVNDDQILRLFNSKELNLINKIFTSFDFQFPLRIQQN